MKGVEYEYGFSLCLWLSIKGGNMYYCLVCGSALKNFPVPRNRNRDLYGCPGCNILFIKKEDHHSGPDLEPIAGATYREVLLAYQAVITDFEAFEIEKATREEIKKTIKELREKPGDAMAALFKQQLKIEKKWREIKLPDVVRLALIET
jgi:hypothetical protein